MMVRFSVLLCAALVPGCGTIVNLTKGTPAAINCPPPGPTIVFGGVRNDLEYLSAYRVYPAILTGAVIADLPFSIAADMLTLPVTIPIAYLNASKEKEEQMKSESLQKQSAEEMKVKLRGLNANSTDSEILKRFGSNWEQPITTNDYYSPLLDIQIVRHPSGKTVLKLGTDPNYRSYELPVTPDADSTDPLRMKSVGR